MDRVLRVLLSNSNLAGCTLALGVVLAYLVGIVQQYWFALALLGYALGYLAMYRERPEHCPEGLSTTQALQWLQGNALPKLSGEAQALLRSILDVVADISPRIKAMEGEGLVQAENRAKLKQLVTRYLPDALETYLKLPSLYAKSAKVTQDKTPYLLLVDQLRLLDGHVKELRDGVYSQNVNELLANGQFLREKFDTFTGFKL